MTRLSTAVLAAFVAAGIGTTPVAAQPIPPSLAPSPEFGSAPSSLVPILFNDHHVYAKPDTLRANRVLAALVRGGTILIPLRSMFEQMGARVSYDPATKTADVSKPGADVKVTVGRSEVVINGESRPLDVPPEIYDGTIVVPIRVISEGMGAYVQWVPDRRVVVVRYVAAPVPTPESTPVPATPAPQPTAPPVATPAPTPTPKAKPERTYEQFVVGDYIFSPKVYNEFSAGNQQEGSSQAGRGVAEFPLGNIPFMLEFDAEQYAYPHVGDYDGTVARNAPCPVSGERGCVTTLGGGASLYVPSFKAEDRDFDARLGVQVLSPRIYVGLSYLWLTNNYGYPQVHGPGLGIEKLPDLDHALSVFGDYYYYPQLSGNFSAAGVPPSQLQYRFAKYEAGLTYALPLARNAGFGIFIEGGWMGNSAFAKQLAPIDTHEAGPFAGIGIKF